MTGRGRQRLAVWGLLAPAVILLILFFVLPSVDLFRLSLARIDEHRAIHADIVSATNYREFAVNPYYHRMVWGSLKLTVWVTALCLVLGYPATHYMVHVRSPMHRTILYAIVVSPLAKHMDWLNKNNAAATPRYFKCRMLPPFLLVLLYH